jgi:uncharacterized protein (DUF2126 family)
VSGIADHTGDGGGGDDRCQGQIEQALSAHDEALARHGVDIWLGGEPTFTNRHSNAPEWTFAADGEQKRQSAEAIVRQLATIFPGTLLLRTLGRQYPDEERPRWSLGIMRWRSGEPAWRGPLDPLAGGLASDLVAPGRLRECLAAELSSAGFSVRQYDCSRAPLAFRLAFCQQGVHSGFANAAPLSTEVYCRPPIASQEIPPAGARDEAAEQGTFIVAFGYAEEPSEHARAVVRVELPSFGSVGSGAGARESVGTGAGQARESVGTGAGRARASVDAFMAFIEHLQRAASRANIAGLVISGHAPPVDERLFFSTVTPDPGVVEVNMAPSTTLLDFYRAQKRIFFAAAEVGLSASKLHFNGEVEGSGGGGHITLGGATPQRSPFFVSPQLLPRLIAYVNRHPSLSYWFTSAAGGSSQAPRADEGARESQNELALALYRLERERPSDPDVLWRTLAPFMVDRFGNTHRAELNLEKLHNPYLSGRGKLGLVEFRAFRMAPTPEHAVAYAALIRALCARLMIAEASCELARYGRELQDRFALPYFLRDDLEAVLADLERHGVGLQSCLASALLDDSALSIAERSIGALRLTLRHAIEFWPLVGDLSAQQATSRIVDPSCRRLELSLSGDCSEIEPWTIGLGGYRFALRTLADRQLALMGVRYRAFMPNIGLHPTVAPYGPLVFTLQHREQQNHLRLTLHAWRPDGEAYDGLPRDEKEAARRRDERVVVEHIAGRVEDLAEMPRAALSDYCVDTRYLI